MDQPTLTLQEVATRLNRSPATLRSRWRRLASEHGFPKPLPGLGLLWSRAMVDAWIADPNQAPRPANENRPTVRDAIQQSNERLRARYGKR